MKRLLYCYNWVQINMSFSVDSSTLTLLIIFPHLHSSIWPSAAISLLLSFKNILKTYSSSFICGSLLLFPEAMHNWLQGFHMCLIMVFGGTASFCSCTFLVAVLTEVGYTWLKCLLPHFNCGTFVICTHCFVWDPTKAMQLGLCLMQVGQCWRFKPNS